jgi:hypothetical protein
MKYVIVTHHFIAPMYFMDHPGEGFSITTDLQRAKVFRSRKKSKVEADRLTVISGMKAGVKRR